MNLFGSAERLTTMQKSSSFAFRYYSLPVTVEFYQGYEMLWPKALRRTFGFGVPVLRETTIAKISTPNGWISAKVRRNPKDRHSWAAGRFEALRKILLPNFDRTFRKIAMEAYSWREELRGIRGIPWNDGVNLS